MPSTTAHNNLRWADLLVEECVRHGVDTFYAAPGSRSTPLIMAVSRHPSAQLFIHVDERATAFMALGYGRATNRPAAWITTSGTALANGYPAIVEASMEAVPMLLLTADRPPELRDTDANQTIRQDRIFGSHVRWFVDVPPPTEDIPIKWLLTTVGEAVHRSQTGPVHVNCMFRKPLVPEASDTPDRDAWWRGEKQRMASPGWKRWTETNNPFTTHLKPHSCDNAVLDDVDARLRKAEHPLVVFGRLRGNPEDIRAAASAFLARYGAVGVADIGSQLRLGIDETGILPSIDAVLYGQPVESLTPDLIIQFGATPVSRRLVEWAPDALRIVVDHRPRRIDPLSRGGLRVEWDAIAVLKGLAARSNTPEVHDTSSWQDAWHPIESAVRAWLDQDLGEELTEQRTARDLSRLVPEDAALIVASSNPVRHLDQFAATDGANVPVSVNRGASGIDGTLATACGFSDGSGRRPVILTGDLALLHDMTSLALCAKRNAVVVVINNDGGGIFSYLPIREHEEVFEPWFGTPHGMDFRAAAQQFGMGYHHTENSAAFGSVVEAAFQRKKAVLIEVTTDREANLIEQRRLLRALRDRIAAGLS